MVCAVRMDVVFLISIHFVEIAQMEMFHRKIIRFRSSTRLVQRIDMLTTLPWRHMACVKKKAHGSDHQSSIRRRISEWIILMIIQKHHHPRIQLKAIRNKAIHQPMLQSCIVFRWQQLNLNPSKSAKPQGVTQNAQPKPRREWRDMQWKVCQNSRWIVDRLEDAKSRSTVGMRWITICQLIMRKEWRRPFVVICAKKLYHPEVIL